MSFGIESPGPDVPVEVFARIAALEAELAAARRVVEAARDSDCPTGCPLCDALAAYDAARSAAGEGE